MARPNSDGIVARLWYLRERWRWGGQEILFTVGRIQVPAILYAPATAAGYTGKHSGEIARKHPAKTRLYYNDAPRDQDGEAYGSA